MASDGRGWTFTYDARLTKAVNSASGVTMAYAYDHANLRSESVRNPTGTKPDGTPAGGTRTRFLLSGSEEVADIEVSATGTRTVTRRYVPGAAIDERLADINAQTGAVHFLHTDRQNSVVAISDAAGNPVARRGYGTYGETDPAQMTGAGAASHPFGYTGRRWDPDLGLYYYRARWYDPQLGTFLQTDPIGAKDYINLYSYVGAEPGNGTDPSGMQTRPWPNGFIGTLSEWREHNRRQQEERNRRSDQREGRSQGNQVQGAVTAPGTAAEAAASSPRVSGSSAGNAGRVVGRTNAVVSGVATATVEGANTQRDIAAGVPAGEAAAYTAGRVGTQAAGGAGGAVPGAIAGGAVAGVPGAVVGGAIGAFGGTTLVDGIGLTDDVAEASQESARQSGQESGDGENRRQNRRRGQ